MKLLNFIVSIFRGLDYRDNLGTAGNNDIWKFSVIVTLFLRLGKTRLIRSLALREKELDWINASRTLGSNPIKIILSQMMPNLVSIIVNGTLSLAANIGRESGLSFLGFGFPED